MVVGKPNLVWDEVKGVRNLNRELIKSRSKYKFFIEKIFGKKIVDYLKYLRSRKKLIKLFKKHKSQKKLQNAQKVAIIFIGTSQYIKFFPRFYTSIKELFIPKSKKDFFVFTDKVDIPYINGKKDVKIVPIKHEGTSLATLLRFKQINNISSRLRKYSHIFYIDADMFAKSPITEEEFFCHNKSLFAMHHPLFLNVKGQFETNLLSTAAINPKKDDLTIYRQCCFWGGKTKEILKMCKDLDKNVKKDLDKSIIAIWLDESHLNKYLIKNVENVYTYGAEYGYPEQWPVPRGFKRKFIHGKGNILK